MESNMFLRDLFALPRWVRVSCVVGLDVSLCVLTGWIAFYLRLGQPVPLYPQGDWLLGYAVVISILLMISIFVPCKFYQAINRYGPALLSSNSIFGFILYFASYAGILTVWGVPGIPRTIGIIQPVLLFLGIFGSRTIIKYFATAVVGSRSRSQPQLIALIYGAGSAGRQLLQACNDSIEIRIIGFIDDDPKIQGLRLNGVRVFALEDIDYLIDHHSVSHVLLAINNISKSKRGQIIKSLTGYNIAIRTVPSFSDLLAGRLSIKDLRRLKVEDLLARPEVLPEYQLLNCELKGKTVVITGAAGTIGGELARQVLDQQPRELVLLDIHEYGLYKLNSQCEQILSHYSAPLKPKVSLLLGSVNDSKLITELFERWNVDIIFHSAAYKHVPIVELNPIQGIQNNVFGTLTIAQAAAEAKVRKFVLISTDKAVRPSNVMGASKRLAEMILQSLDARSENTEGDKTIFSMVRFGNVLASSGSVIPRFEEQIDSGGPLTLTHPDVTRFFMTQNEAAQLVIQSVAMSEGGDVFILDMGSPVKIMDLATKMIELSDLTVKNNENPDGDIAIEIVGLRPGEKLFEELLLGDDAQDTLHPRIMRAQETFEPWNSLSVKLATLQLAIDAGDRDQVLKLVANMVEGYIRYDSQGLAQT